MPAMPLLTPEQRLAARWEHRAGKVLKDWATRLMRERTWTRERAREHILLTLEQNARGETQ